MHETFDIFPYYEAGACALPLFKKKHMKDKYMWIVRYNNRAIDRVDPINYNPDILEWTLDSAFDTFPKAQNHLLNILKADHAQVFDDISRLSIELTAIEAKIRIVNTSSEQDYIV